MPRTILRCFLTNAIIEEFKIFFFLHKIVVLGCESKSEFIYQD